MIEKESHPYPHLPALPDPWPKPPDVVPPPSALPVDARGESAPPVGGIAPTHEPTVETTTASERERVTLTGRLGQDPTLRTSRNGVLIARFPLGVKDEADLNKTTWHTVLAFRDRAAMVRDTLHRGDAVEIVGYKHQRDIPGRNGPRTIEEIYATVIKPRS
jgi:hypothetical protein